MEQTTAQGTWRYLPEVALAGLAGGVAWWSWAGDATWVSIAPCVGIPVGTVAALFVRPRRLLDWAAASVLAGLVVVAMPLSAFGMLFALLSLASLVSAIAAVGVSLGHVAEFVVRRWGGPRLQMGGMAGAAVVAILLLCAFLFPGRHPLPVVTPLADLLFVWAYPVMPPVWLASVLVVAFLDYRGQ